MKDSKKELSVIIVTYNSSKDIENCIGSIYRMCDLPLVNIEIIIVDNSPLPVFIEMKDIILTQFGSEIILIHNSKNGGYGQGNNIGIKAATSPYVLVVNPDVTIETPMFRKSLKMFADQKKTAVIGGKQIGGKNISFWNLPEFDFFVFTAPLSISLNKANIYIEKYFYLSGALLFIDKNKFEEIGLFDEDMFLYCEESDILQRFRQHQYHAKFEKMFIYKHHVDDRDDISEKSFNFLMESSKHYLKKHNKSYLHFLKKKIWAYKLMSFLYRVFRKSDQKKKTDMYLNRFIELHNKEKENVYS